MNRFALKSTLILVVTLVLVANALPQCSVSPNFSGNYSAVLKESIDAEPLGSAGQLVIENAQNPETLLGSLVGLMPLPPVPALEGQTTESPIMLSGDVEDSETSISYQVNMKVLNYNAASDGSVERIQFQLDLKTVDAQGSQLSLESYVLEATRI